MNRCRFLRAVVMAVLAGALMFAAVGPSWANQNCTASTNQPASAPPITVRVDSNARAVVGKPVVMYWVRRKKTAWGCDDAAYLVAATPAIRLAGEGFFALPGGAPTPFGIRAWPTSTRIIVPLQLVEYTKSGTISVTPFTSGALALEWKVVSVRNGQTADVPGSAGKTQVTVTAGNPSITVSDPVFLLVHLSRHSSLRTARFGSKTMVTILDSWTRRIFRRCFRELARSRPFLRPGASSISLMRELPEVMQVGPLYRFWTVQLEKSSLPGNAARTLAKTRSCRCGGRSGTLFYRSAQQRERLSKRTQP